MASKENKIPVGQESPTIELSSVLTSHCCLRPNSQRFVATFSQIPESAISTLSSKGFNLYRSLQRIVEYVAGGQLSYDVSSWVTKDSNEREIILNKVRSSGDEGYFAVIVGKQFQGIIQGTVDPLTLTMKDDALGRYYANNSRMVRQWYVENNLNSKLSQY
jgi:hypothetical protein